MPAIAAPLENVATALYRKRYSSGAISPGSNTLPGATGATALRHTSFGLSWKPKAIDASAEVREDRQVAGLALVGCQTAGSVQGLLSGNTYTDELEAVFRGAKAPALTKTQADNLCGSVKSGGGACIPAKN